MPYLKILSTAEQHVFDSPPIFTGEERKRFFLLTGNLERYVVSLRTDVNKMGFLLQFGYFKAKKRFYSKQTFQLRDIEYVAQKLHISDTSLEAYENTAVMWHRRSILRHFGYSAYTKAAEETVKEQTRLLLIKQLQPKRAFLSLLEVLEYKKIVIPPYHRLMQIITNVFRLYEKELVRLLEIHISQKERLLLDGLLTQPKTDEGKDSYRYALTTMKKVGQSTRPTKIKETLADHLYLSRIFQDVESIIPSLQLSPDLIQFYAGAVIKSQVFQIARRDKRKYIYLLSFIVHQYYLLQDTLFDILILAVTAAVNRSVSQHKEIFFTMRKTKSDAIEQIVTITKTQQEIFSQMRSVIADEVLTDDEKIFQIKLLVADYATHNEPTDRIIDVLQKETTRLAKDDDYYDTLETQSLKLQNRVSDIIKQVEFDEATSDKDIIAGINFYKKHEGDITSSAPIAFLNEQEQTAIFDSNGKLRISLYKALLFIHIATLIKSGGLNLKHSYKYKAFEAYLLPTETWNEQKNETLTNTNLSSVSDPTNVIKTVSISLDKTYTAVNRSILKGENSYCKIRPNGTYAVSTPKEEKEYESISDIFPKARSVSLLSVIAAVNGFTRFTDAFCHFQTTHVGKKPATKTFYAGLIGLGCNIGTVQFAQIARGINQNELENTINWYFSVENLMNANDAIIRFIDRLSVPKLFKKDHTKTHTSSDGQKFAIGVDSLNSNYSYKYFGKGKGVSVYSFIDDTHSLFYSTVISSSEREAAYVIDGLLHNDVVKSDIHSTDTHGYSEIIFAITYLLGYSFAPRIRNFQEQQLYSFIKPKTYQEKGYKILPVSTVNTEIIEEQWDQILRLIATLKLKETTASQLLKRLSSYSRQHPLYRALKAFGQIIKSIYLLQYIDDVRLRQSVEKQLNKLESSNKFAKAVFYGNNQEFQQETKEEQLVAEGSKRLIENSIILWNYLYVSQKIAETETEEERKKLITVVKNSSVIAWEHINLQGEYDFADEKLENTVPFSLPKILELEVG